MKDLLPEILDEVRLKSLEEENRIVYFNYLDIDKYKDISKEHLTQMLKGKSHVIVDKHLYVKYGNFDYKLHKKNWTKTEEGRKYKFLLENICSNE